jgi:hypothetical protein
MLPFYALIFPEYINLSKKGSIEVKWKTKRKI